MSIRALYVLSAFSESTRKTIRLIAEYLGGRGQRCFTYRGLRRYWDRKRAYYTLEWHTAERAIRKLAEDGWLKRVEIREKKRGGGRKVLFCLTEPLRILLEEMRWLSYRDAGGEEPE